MTAAGLVVVVVVVVVVAMAVRFLWSAHLDYRCDQIEKVKRRHPSRRRDKERER